MAVPRTLLAAALLGCTAMAALTACDPADSGPTVTAASAAAAADDQGEDPLADDFGDEDDLDAVPSAPGAPSSPTPGCTAPAPQPGHQVVLVVTADASELTARPADYSCAQTRYLPTGPAVHYGFADSGVTATLAERPRPVPLDELIDHLGDCLAAQDPATCHGNAYDVALDQHGRISRIGELDLP
ncbi:hypothetical protein [Streptomyces sp. NRRL WC-3742]|uniref:hypothetical protein n=1 Tax=Streptomyces sp. NRRL WC-3742 TaxID=1463934 RepID=UPI0004CC67EA|nr:hypothetical protein [Streptomyces sp. NRRL WC-3742]